MTRDTRTVHLSATKLRLEITREDIVSNIGKREERAIQSLRVPMTTRVSEPPTQEIPLSPPAAEPPVPDQLSGSDSDDLSRPAPSHGLRAFSSQEMKTYPSKIRKLVDFVNYMHDTRNEVATYNILTLTKRPTEHQNRRIEARADVMCELILLKDALNTLFSSS